MKKTILIVALCLVISLCFCGCSEQKGSTDKNSGTVMGKIEAIDENVITLALADSDTMFEGASDFNPENFKGEMPSGFDPENFKGEMPSDFDPENFKGEIPSDFDRENFEGEMPSDFDPENFKGEMPSGFDPENFDGERPENGDMPGNFGFGMGGMMGFDASELTYTGETETYTVPEGMKIGDGDYTSLKVDDVVMISFDQEGGISELRVIPAESESGEKATESKSETD